MPLAAQALSSDRQQSMLINSDHAKIVQNKDNNQPGVTYLSGDVTMDQGTTRARGDEATIYQHAANAKDATANPASTGRSNRLRRAGTSTDSNNGHAR